MSIISIFALLKNNPLLPVMAHLLIFRGQSPMKISGMGVLILNSELARRSYFKASFSWTNVLAGGFDVVGNSP